MSMALLIGKEIFGAKNWVYIGSFSFQPSEFGKLFLVAYLASALKDYKDFKTLIEPAGVVMVCLGFSVLQRDLGTALIVFALSVTILYISTSKFKYVLVCLLLFMAGGYISYKLFGHVRQRVMIWRDPWPYATDESMQIIQSLIAIAWGGLFGKGLGFGYPQYIPVSVSDFIFTVICEELGIIAGLGIIIIYFLLFYRGMRTAVYVEDNFSRLLAVGYSTIIAAQALVILGGVINLIPLTGITLPMISYGGTSMLMTFCFLGMVQKISEEN
jgi:cell division protein FtsW (lipid II flippase)